MPDCPVCDKQFKDWVTIARHVRASRYGDDFHWEFVERLTGEDPAIYVAKRSLKALAKVLQDGHG